MRRCQEIDVSSFNLHFIFRPNPLFFWRANFEPRILDADGSGEISFEEFVSGCMQLQGPAQSVQLARMRYENKVMRQELRHVGREQLRQLYKDLILFGLCHVQPNIQGTCSFLVLAGFIVLNDGFIVTYPFLNYRHYY